MISERLKYGKIKRFKLYTYMVVICLQIFAFSFCQLMITKLCFEFGYKCWDKTITNRVLQIRSFVGLLGGLLGGILDKFGRRKLMLGTGFCAIIILIISLFMSQFALAIAYILISGMCRIIAVSTIFFIKEIIPLSPTFGILFYQVAINIGAALGRTTVNEPPTPITDEYYLRKHVIALGFCVTSIALQLVALAKCYTYETPLYLIEKGNYNEARLAIKEFLYGDDETASIALNIAKNKAIHKKTFTVSWKQLIFNKHHVLSLLLGLVIMLLHIFSFTAAYTLHILAEGIVFNTLLTLLINSLSGIGPLFYIFVRRYHPRTIILFGLTLTLALLLVSFFLTIAYVYEDKDMQTPALLINVMLIFLQFFLVSPISFVYVAKCLPDKSVSIVIAAYTFVLELIKLALRELSEGGDEMLIISPVTAIFFSFINLLVFYFFVGRGPKPRWKLLQLHSQQYIYSSFK
eukprot:TRINITY_DN121956_c0_g1_i1.p1 TRINITY_DN121956_c0_g1~~TRINITY_DN121956_c0_g1_i1.p1  ORF type:complete len:494 (-),score=-2.57 TRINITY_DN121956_c0_g1_i1:129-1514(-)